MFRQLVCAVLAAVVALVARPAQSQAQKALVYCPAGDAAGCGKVVAALASRFEAVDRAFDGSNGTVDLATADLAHYAVIVVPSLADGEQATPYALLRANAGRLKMAVTGRVAVFSGAPDQGATNRAAKDALLANLATWAAAGHRAKSGLVGLVALQDLSENAAARYDWVAAISPVAVSADTELRSWRAVKAMRAGASSMLRDGEREIAYPNMASFGLHIGKGSSARTMVGAVGGEAGQTVLVTHANADEATSGNGMIMSAVAGGDTTWITTDKQDYLPGDTVTFTGGNWAPGDTVRITVHEDPHWVPEHQDRQVVAVAGSDGKFSNRDFVIHVNDYGVTFTATAVGSPSGRTATHVFTDGGVLFQLATTDNALSPTTSPAVTWTAYYKTYQGSTQNPDKTCSGAATDGSQSYSNNAGTSVQVNANGSLKADSATATGYRFLYFSSSPSSTTPLTGSALCIPGTQSGNNVVIGTLYAHFEVAARVGNVTASASIYGGTTNLSATVTPAGLTGSVAFYVNGSATAASGTVTYDPATGSATLSGYAHGLNYSATAYSVRAVFTPTSGSAVEATNTSALVVNRRPLTASATGVNKVYDGTTTATVTLSSDALSGDVVTLDYTAASFADRNVGTGKTVNISGISITGGAAAGNYALQNTTASTTANITPRPISVKACDVTREYGATTPAFTLELAGGTTLGSGDALTDLGTPTFTPTGTAVVGSPWPIDVSGLSNGNYSISYAAGDARGKLTVTPKALTITASNRTKTYGDVVTFTGTEFTASGLVGAETVGSVTLASAGAAGTAAVGSYPIVPSAATGGTFTATNYTITYTNGTLTVDPKALKITANDRTKTYGDALALGTTEFTPDGLVNGDAVNSVTLTSAGAAATAQVAGSPYSITPSAAVGTGLGNYTITYLDGKLTVNPRSLTVTATGENKVYDGTTAATVTLNSDKLSGDVVTLGYTAASFTDKNVGPGKTVNVSGISISGAAAGNYALQNITAVTTADITTRPVMVKAKDVTRVYGASTPAFELELAGGTTLGSGDALTDLGTPTFTPTGTAVVGSPWPIDVSGLSNGNYSISYAAGDARGKLTVTPKALTITASNRTKTYGDVVTFTGTEFTASGLVGAETVGSVTLFSAGAAASAGVAGNPYAIVPSAATGGTFTASNYSITYTNGTLTVAPKPLAITATANPTSVAYPNNPTFDVTYDGFVTTENVGTLGGALSLQVRNATGSTVIATAPLTSPLDANSGANPKYLIRASGLTSTNYAITFVDGEFTVTNDAPVIDSVTGPLPVAIGTGGTASASVTTFFTDPGIPSDLSSYVVSSSWLRSGATTPLSFPGTMETYVNSKGKATITATGLTTGVYTVTVTVEDKFNSTSAPYVYRYVVIYDPSAGFVTGGGWITADNGSCIAANAPAGVCTNATGGRANFGFVSKYQRGQQAPSGNTEFQFQAGNLNFKSSAYEWLVLNGTTQAQFKGTGTINGTGSFGFLVTGVDGDNFGQKKPDGFRIKIWNVATGQTVFDNKITESETNLEAATLLSGGSITIHAK